RRGVFRVELDRLVVVGDGLVVLRRRRIGNAAIVVGRRLLMIGLDRLVVVGDGLVDVAFGLPFDAAVGIRERQGLAVVGAGLDRAGAGGDRLVARGLGAGFPVVGPRGLRECGGGQQRSERQQAPIVLWHTSPCGLPRD